MQAPRSTRELPEVEREAIEKTPLLIHSIGHFGEVSRRPLDIVKPRRIVEIGGEGGGFTMAMADWAQRNDAELVTIDPAPGAKLRDLASQFESMSLVEGNSPDALSEIEPAEFYVIDGDHNYHVVRGELEVILGATSDEKAPVLCVLHDTCWPWGRRDLYYAPEELGSDFVHPFTFTAGLTPESAAPQESRGYRGMGSFAVAESSGGPRNGVMTAIEDVIAERSGLELHVIPAIFGLGFLFPSKAPWATELRDFLAPFENSELLATLEHNRLALYLALLDMQDELTLRTSRYNRHLNALEEQFAALAGDGASSGREAAASLRVDNDAKEGKG